jgi:hypothetical protein
MRGKVVDFLSAQSCQVQREWTQHTEYLIKREKNAPQMVFVLKRHTNSEGDSRVDNSQWQRVD